MAFRGISGKGQSSIEFLLVVGVALVVSAPFILSAQESILNIESTSESVSMQNSLNKIEEAVETVGVAGEPARRTFRISIPRGVEEAKVYKKTAIIYTLDTGSGRRNMTKIFDVNVTAPSGLPTEEGDPRITVFAWNNQVNITEVS